MVHHLTRAAIATAILAVVSVEHGFAQTYPGQGFVSGSSCPINSVGCFQFSNLVAPPDLISWNLSFARIGTTFTNVGTSDLGSANQWGVMVQVDIPNVSNSPAAYEKAAIFAHCFTSDPSGGATSRAVAQNARGVTRSYGNPERGCVGIDTRGEIKAGNFLGQVWGIVPGCYIQSGSDGYCVGIEIDINNGGSDQPLMNTVTTKIGMQIEAFGSADSTAGIFFINAGRRFHKGIYADPAALVPVTSDALASFIELIGLFRIMPDGRMVQTATAPADTNVATFSTKTGGQSGIQIGVFPAAGTTSDVASTAYSFSTATGVQYTGAEFSVLQTNATNGLQSTAFQIDLVTNGGPLTQAYQGNSAAFFPFTNNTASLGLTTNRWSNVYTGAIDTTGAINQLTGTLVSGTTAQFAATVNGSMGINIAVIPAVGSNTDQAGVYFSFATSTGVKYNGGLVRIFQTTATNGSQTTAFAIDLVSAGGALTQALVATSAVFFPATDFAMGLGGTTNRWNIMWSYTSNQKPQTLAALGTCTASIAGSRGTINNSTSSIVYRAVATTGASTTAAVFCDGANWLYD